MMLWFLLLTSDGGLKLKLKAEAVLEFPANLHMVTH